MIIKFSVNRSIKKALKEILAEDICKLFYNKPIDALDYDNADSILRLRYDGGHDMLKNMKWPTEYEIAYWICGKAYTLPEDENGMRYVEDQIIVHELHNMFMMWLIQKSKKKYQLCFEGIEDDDPESGFVFLLVKKMWLEEDKTIKLI